MDWSAQVGLGIVCITGERPDVGDAERGKEW
jgi:hypothetical protein